MQDKPDTQPPLPQSKHRLQAYRSLIKQGTGEAEGSHVGRAKGARTQVQHVKGLDLEQGPLNPPQQLDGDVELQDDLVGDPYEFPPDPPPPSTPDPPSPSTSDPPPPSTPDPPPPGTPDHPPPPNAPHHHPQPLHHVFDINQLERSAILPKHTNAIAFVKLLREALLDDPVAKLDDVSFVSVLPAAPRPIGVIPAYIENTTMCENAFASLQTPLPSPAISLSQRLENFLEGDSTIAQYLEPYFATLGREF
ncbi:hypothetical protein EDB19DRAFT_1919400 [Suillus lakei]|nr:hypothetical protein EDB19DRAFT_1919400 [Suillus lakei]